MELISELEARIKNYVRLDKRHLKSLIWLIIALMTLNTVNFTKLAQVSFDNTKATSRYRKIQRFFANIFFDYRLISQFIFYLFDFSRCAQYVTMDRTNWSLGSFEINILFLCIEWHGCAIPIMWLLLPHKGNSATKHRKAILKRFIDLFGKEVIKYFLADREFIGEEWFSYLMEEKIPFCIRVKKDADTTNTRGKSVQVGWLCHHLKYGERLILSGQRRIYGCLLYVSAARSPIDGELMIVVSNVSDEENIDHYLNRWPIECLFGCLKSKGFNFELTKFKRRDRIKKLIVVLAISYCWALKTGVWRHYHEKKIVLKNHGRKAKSFFRYGLDYLQEACLKWLTGRIKQLKQAVALFQHNSWGGGLCHV